MKAAIGLTLAVLLVAAPGFAQDVSQMSGIPLPSGDLPDRTVSVRVVRGTLANNVQGHTVELLVSGTARRLDTDPNGRAIFSDLPAGAEVQATTTLDGRRLESQSFQIPAKGGVRLMLVGPAPPRESGTSASGATNLGRGQEAELGTPGTLTIGGQSRIIVEQNDDALDVFYLFEIVNPGATPVNSGPVTIEMPTGAAGTSLLEGSTPQATAKGPRVVVTAPFQPGSTPVQIGFRFPYAGSRARVRQAFPIALDRLALIAEKAGETKLESGQVSDQREMPVDGRRFIAARGPRVAAGQTLAFELTGLPHHSRIPRYTAIALAIVILVIGGWSVTRRRPEAAVPPLIASTRGGLEKRRERLLEQLVGLEQQRIRRSLSADDYRRRHEALVQDLEQIYRALEITRAA